MVCPDPGPVPRRVWGGDLVVPSGPGGPALGTLPHSHNGTAWSLQQAVVRGMVQSRETPGR